MTREEAKSIILKEAECVTRQGKTGQCCRDEMGCGACALVMEDVKILEAYLMACKALEEPKQGEWISLEKTRCKGQLLPFWRTHECSVCSSTGQGDFNFCPNCGADMRVKDELNRVSKELNSETEYKAKVKELENAIAKCEKAEEDFKKRTCKFKSPNNCDFCSFHSDCDEHWKEGDEK